MLICDLRNVLASNVWLREELADNVWQLRRFKPPHNVWLREELADNVRLW